MSNNFCDEREDHNLVMFPASKNFLKNLVGPESGNDPIADLMNEFSHLGDEDLPYKFDELSEGDFDLLGDGVNEQSFHSLEAFMTRNLRGEASGPDDKLIKVINDQIELIKDAKERIAYYLAEIEMFLPSRKK